ncbi:MAG: spore coat protein [Bacillaceae bacterium]|nr:spore coat protein [Bacillaceae bacterium]
MPNNIEGRGLTDREMVQLCLELEKNRCRSIAETLLETEHQELRNLYQECLNQAYENQNELFRLMSHRGWYAVEPATAEQIGKTQSRMQQNLHPDHQF